MKGFVYVLRSLKNNSYYIGSSKNPYERLKEHNRGRTKYTRNLVPWELILVQECDDMKEARQFEQKLKKLKRRDLIEKMINKGL